MNLSSHRKKSKQGKFMHSRLCICQYNPLFEFLFKNNTKWNDISWILQGPCFSQWRETVPGLTCTLIDIYIFAFDFNFRVTLIKFVLGFGIWRRWVEWSWVELSWVLNNPFPFPCSKRKKKKHRNLLTSKRKSRMHRGSTIAYNLQQLYYFACVR